MSLTNTKKSKEISSAGCDVHYQDEIVKLERDGDYIRVLLKDSNGKLYTDRYLDDRRQTEKNNKVVPYQKPQSDCDCGETCSDNTELMEAINILAKGQKILIEEIQALKKQIEDKW